MDNLTHSLVGALLSKAGLNRVTDSRQATLLAVVAANSPDLDIVTGLVSPAAYITYHRHLTHALVAVPFMAALAVLLARGIYAAWRRLRGRPHATFAGFGGEWVFASLIGLSHPLLDWTNTYGTRLWLPFSDSWSYGDLLFIIDLVVWAILAMSLGLAWRLPRREVVIASAGLLALSTYVAANEVSRRRVLSVAGSRLYDGSKPIEVGAFPAPPGPADWIAYARTEGAQFLTPVDAWTMGANGNPVRLEAAQGLAQVEAAKAGELGRAYSGFSRYPFQLVSVDGGETVVTLADARFYRSNHPVFSCVITLDDMLQVVSERFEF